jgi:hypothetical protein
MKQKTKRVALFTTALSAIIVGVFCLAYLTANAANRYNFSGQGIVSENNIGEKYIRVSFKQISQRAASLAGDVVTVKVNQAKFYKPNAAGTILKQTQTNIGVGMLVTVYGAVKSDNSFSASKVTIVPRKFKIRGKLIAIRKDSKIMTVEISASTYEPTKYVGKTQEISYTDKLTVLHSGGKKDVSKVEPLNQRVVIDGNIVEDNKFEATQLSDPL